LRIVHWSGRIRRYPILFALNYTITEDLAMKRRRLLVVAAGIGAGVLATLLTVGLVLAQGPDEPEYTNFQIQNLSQSTANVVVEVYDTDGDLVASEAITIPAGSSTSFSQNPGVPDPLGLPNGFMGSVLISSDQEVGAIANQFVSADPWNPRVAAAYNGVSEPATDIFFPLQWRQYNLWDTRFFLQNTTDVAATVTLTYTHDSYSLSSVDHVESGVVIPARGTLMRSLYDGLSVLGTGWEGSVQVSSDQPLAGVADGFNSGTPYRFAMNYVGFGPNDADTMVYAPVIFRRYLVPQFGWNTNIFVANVGDNPAEVQVTYIGEGLGSPVTETQLITVSGRFQQDPNTDLPEDFRGAAVIESLNSEPIVAVVLQATSRGPYDRATAYSGVPGSQASDQVSLPMLMKTYFCSLIWNTNIPVLNTEYESGPAEVYVTYTGGGLASSVQRQFTVTDTYLISQFGETSLPGGLPCTTGWRGSATITSTRPIVAVVNENALAVTGDLAETYNGIAY
jgi:hypothetical protein